MGRQWCCRVWIIEESILQVIWLIATFKDFTSSEYSSRQVHLRNFIVTRIMKNLKVFLINLLPI
ncbi:hypothetical protein B7722_06275 [Streptococcus oralis subsp. oralis]|uniref:Uncharacterized protein n=1 Tax=Streptococcus oralis subsp. oralis TaxID=1891914 RepID=A0A1X1GW12_STROR|nr:hypothetical protein B7722_06275 [Streptococcus oralis subsp. oralis]RKV84435.1 MAG: hypothetical protein D8H99_42070 [Streptococcus sp.]